MNNMKINDLIFDIKLLASININEKIDTVNKVKCKNNVICRIRRYISNESRHSTLTYIYATVPLYLNLVEKNVIKKDVELLKSLLNGLSNLSSTYKDLYFNDKISFVMDKIDKFII